MLFGLILLSLNFEHLVERVVVCYSQRAPVLPGQSERVWLVSSRCIVVVVAAAGGELHLHATDTFFVGTGVVMSVVGAAMRPLHCTEKLGECGANLSV